MDGDFSLLRTDKAVIRLFTIRLKPQLESVLLATVCDAEIMQHVYRLCYGPPFFQKFYFLLNGFDFGRAYDDELCAED
ncbi:hypothetical protein FKW31_00555 [Acetobacter sp. DmW_136]|uniref:hypothetical protein n=1 Tax=Acetobacter sp. DmW_136 TaxID=2591091 RepID=UPI0012392370|nr:hypothetical protein [Acetobacter sp. DmW_136]KAA8388579.1 hypothetical protein FKW31_00555 [Acetobacter sp. DmW_136]